MKKVELFASDDIDMIEQGINEWLATNPDYSVEHINFSTSGHEDKVLYSAIIYYRK